MTYYVIIGRGKRDHVVAGPFASKQRARLAKENYFFTSYDKICDEVPDRQTISHNHSYAISCCSVAHLPDWKNGSLHGSNMEISAKIEPGRLF